MADHLVARTTTESLCRKETMNNFRDVAIVDRTPDSQGVHGYRHSDRGIRRVFRSPRVQCRMPRHHSGWSIDYLGSLQLITILVEPIRATKHHNDTN